MKRPWYKSAGLFVAGILMLPALPVVLLVFLAFGIYCGISNFFSQLSFRQRMISCQRYLSRQELLDRIESKGGGTLILDSPSIGWRFRHAWWTPDQTQELAPSDCPTDEEYRRAVENGVCLEWDRWHWEHYTNPRTGSAYLLRARNVKPIESWVRKQLPGMTVVKTWSGSVHLAKEKSG